MTCRKISITPKMPRPEILSVMASLEGGHSTQNPSGSSFQDGGAHQLCPLRREIRRQPLRSEGAFLHFQVTVSPDDKTGGSVCITIKRILFTFKLRMPCPPLLYPIS